tara:strand:+ start:7877 stop:8770 length:894 start_codon:yes stop_codon:yes gene_type:complete
MTDKEEQDLIDKINETKDTINQLNIDSMITDYNKKISDFHDLLSGRIQNELGDVVTEFEKTNSEIYDLVREANEHISIHDELNDQCIALLDFFGSSLDTAAERMGEFDQHVNELNEACTEEVELLTDNTQELVTNLDEHKNSLSEAVVEYSESYIERLSDAINNASEVFELSLDSVVEFRAEVESELFESFDLMTRQLKEFTETVYQLINENIGQAIQGEIKEIIEPKIQSVVDEVLDSLFDQVENIKSQILNNLSGNSDVNAESEVSTNMLKAAIDPLMSALENVKSLASTVGIPI